MIAILRLGHRVGRDDRISTHCGLVSRALGASSIIYSGDRDDKMVTGINSVSERWGGKFEVGYNANWKKVLMDFKRRKYTIVHLTAYGMPLQEKITAIRKNKNVLVVVGSEKVPGEIYQLADYNISVTSQPHSEIAALALFLYSYNDKALEQKFTKSKIKIIPQEKGKKVEEG
ncbi:MAG TPA: tRNA (cytidine(56)-2'-O)-methyltransferase [archaeon]|nr:tRNA (cytidine(56)-2'-O)-methyltransferase [archaeon]